MFTSLCSIFTHNPPAPRLPRVSDSIVFRSNPEPSIMASSHGRILSFPYVRSSFNRACLIFRDATSQTVFSRMKKCNSIARLQNWHNRFIFLQECTCGIFVKTFLEFRIRLEEKSVTFSVRHSKDSHGKNVIGMGRFDNIQLLLRSFVRETKIH